MLLLGCLQAYSQPYFADYMVVGSSLTYLQITNKDDYGNKNGYDEYTWNVNTGIRVSKRLFTGMQVLMIYSSEINTNTNFNCINIL